MKEDALECLEALVMQRVVAVEEENEALRNRLECAGHHPAGDDAFGVGRQLPVPRLQMSYVVSREGREGAWYTGLVMAPYWSRDVLSWVPIEATRTTAGGRGDVLCEPFRGSAHLRHDAEQLGLPAYVVDHHCKLWGRVGTILEWRDGVLFNERGALA